MGRVAPREDIDVDPVLPGYDGSQGGPGRLGRGDPRPILRRPGADFDDDPEARMPFHRLPLSVDIAEDLPRRGAREVNGIMERVPKGEVHGLSDRVRRPVDGQRHPRQDYGHCEGHSADYDERSAQTRNSRADFRHPGEPESRRFGMHHSTSYV